LTFSSLERRDVGKLIGSPNASNSSGQALLNHNTIDYRPPTDRTERRVGVKLAMDELRASARRTISARGAPASVAKEEPPEP
jgi:hypothetical protein